ncbi:histidine phosphatase family protein [Oscillatoria sp. HE19RPO]|uniref:histidine phosphatase family protein n=1 Tax=Oscillatoria sp. HE19RPO TaxID=2954806 RepID=UPI0020C490D0|nr:histidine phosphatase family protein [Oscillatoria sp. HE19RPO]
MSTQSLHKITDYTDFPRSGSMRWEDIYQRLESPIVFPQIVDLHLIRHAQTETNAKKLITGSLNVELTKQGEEQARSLGLKLDPHYEVGFCSDLHRSQRTLDLAVEQGQVRVDEIFKDFRLNERRLGVLEGQKFHWIPEYEAGDLNYAPENGESYREVSRRILAFLIDLADQVLNQRVNKILISGHMGPMRIMVGILENRENASDVMGLSFPNAEVLKFSWSALKLPRFLQDSH